MAFIRSFALGISRKEGSGCFNEFPVFLSTQLNLSLRKTAGVPGPAAIPGGWAAPPSVPARGRPESVTAEALTAPHWSARLFGEF